MEKLFKRPTLVVGVVVAITVFMAAQIPRVELDNNNMRFLPEGNLARIVSNYTDETFGGQVMILVGLERPYQTIFEKQFLERIREYSRAVETVEFVKLVNSIMSTQYITGDSEGIIVTELVPEDFSGTGEEIDELQRRIASWDLFRGALVSDDLSATQILITLDVTIEDSTLPKVARSLEKIRALTNEKFHDLATVYITGQPVINATINESMIADNILLIPLVVVVLLGVLIFSFRRFTFVALPLLTVFIAVVWTVGTSALFGIKLSILTTILPVILLAVGSAYGIHVVTHYAKDTLHTTLPADEHRALVFDLMRKLIKPVSLAALTTFAGFISFCFTPIVPIKEFGFCAGVGVVAAFTVAVTFIPAMLLIRGPRTLKERRSKHGGSIAGDGFSNVIADVFMGIAQRKTLVLVVAVLVAGISVYALSRVIVDNVIVEWLQNETDISRSDRFIREYFGGSKEVNIVVEADTSEELLHPDVLQAMDNLSVFLARLPEVGKVVGFTDIIKRLNQVLNVGQSPDGLQPTAFSAEDSGFGDFGFGNFDFNDVVPQTPKQEASHDLAQYNTADLIRFLDTAAGTSPNLNGGDLVRELKRLTNYEGMAYYEIPSDPRRYGKETPEELQQLVSNYLILLAGDDNSGYSNHSLDPTAMRTMVQLRTIGNNDSQEIIEKIKAYASVNFPPNIRVMIGGGATIEGAITDLIVTSSIISIGLSVLMVFIIVAVSNKSLIAGIIGAVTLTLAILCNFAIMGLLGIKLNIGTALMGSLAVGIGIDYTIHFIEFFKREYKAEQQDFLRRTFIGCGKAILVNALSVGLGFGVLAFSRFQIVADLGILVAFCMMITAVISLTVIPALLTVIKPKFIYGAKL